MARLNNNGILFREGLPAVDIKVMALHYTDDVMKKFGCFEEQANNAIQFAFETEQESFYEYWIEGKAINKYFRGRKVKADQVGRSGGHLVVEGLPDPYEKPWSDKLIQQWYKFENDVDEDIKHRTSLENISSLIEINRWCKDGAKEYNFITTSKGYFNMMDIKNEVNQFSQEKFGMDAM